MELNNMGDQMNEMGSNGWGEWGKHVLSELRRLNASMSALEESIKQGREYNDAKIEAVKDITNDKINALDKRLLTIEVKASAYGAVAGLVVAIIQYFMSK